MINKEIEPAEAFVDAVASDEGGDVIVVASVSCIYGLGSPKGLRGGVLG